MKAKECRGVRREIDSSELGQRFSDQVENHLRACPACAQFQVERGQLRELVGSLRPVAAPADFDMRLRARIARERDRSARQPFIFRFALTTPGIAVAAILVIMVALGVWINQRNRPSAPSSTAGNPKEAAPTSPNAGTNATNGQQNQQTNDRVVAVKPINQKRLNVPQPRGPRFVPSADPGSQVSEFNTRAAEAIRQRADRDGEVSLPAPSKPMVVTVQDANGATRKILLPPISFGSQRFDNRTNVSMTNRRDW
jgi:hypothetical protein